jgi:hypothetical protein
VNYILVLCWHQLGLHLNYSVVPMCLCVTVSDALKPQRRFTISGLSSASVYQLRIEAHNIAGSSTAEFTFVTLTKEGGESQCPSVTEVAVCTGSGLYVSHSTLLYCVA